MLMMKIVKKRVKLNKTINKKGPNYIKSKVTSKKHKLQPLCKH